MAIIKYTPLTYNKDYEYPLSGQLLGGFLGVASTIWVPLYFMYSLIRAPGVKLREVMNEFSAHLSHSFDITLLRFLFQKWQNAIAPQMAKSLQLREAQMETEYPCDEMVNLAAKELPATIEA